MALETFPECQSICSAQSLLAILVLVSTRKKLLVLGDRTGKESEPEILKICRWSFC